MDRSYLLLWTLLSGMLGGLGYLALWLDSLGPDSTFSTRNVAIIGIVWMLNMALNYAVLNNVVLNDAAYRRENPPPPDAHEHPKVSRFRRR